MITKHCPYRLTIECEDLLEVKGKTTSSGMNAGVKMVVTMKGLLNVDEIIEYLEENGFLVDYIKEKEALK